MKIINENNTTVRSFRMTIGLEEGYEGIILHTRSQVIDVIGKWLAEKKKSEGVYIPGCLREGSMLYFSRRQQKTVSEPVVIYEGEISPEYNSEVPDDVIKKTLIELASVLSAEFHQERIYLVYRDQNLILQKEG